MKYIIERTKDFKKSFKKLSTKNQENVLEFIHKLADDTIDKELLKNKHKDHKLRGEFQGCRECHIKPDLLFIYQKKECVLTLLCVDIGSHSELFE